MTYPARTGLYLKDTTGANLGLINNAGAPQICAQSYLQALAEGDISSHTPFHKMGYNPDVDTGAAGEDLWSAGGTYAFPTAAMQIEIVSGDAGDNDLATKIKGNAFGADQTVQSDAGGTTTTLVDADVDFEAATAVAIGDCILLDPVGASPEWGYVTTVATHTLTCSGGFSSGGSGATRYYTVVDKSAKDGAQVVKINYLTNTFADKTILMGLDGDAAVESKGTGGLALSDIYRINSFRVIFSGANEVPTGALTLRKQGAGTTYSYITAGFTQARNSAYTVPYGKTLYITSIMVSGCGATAARDIRWTLRVGAEQITHFRTQVLFPWFEVNTFDASFFREFELPLKVLSGTDMKIRAIAGNDNTFCCSALRGWLE